MKRTVIQLVVLVAFTLGLNGCGGGSSSSKVGESSNTFSPSTETASLIFIGETSTIEISPLSELGLEVGEEVCLRIKAYTNTSKSDFSEAVCTKIIDDESIELSWNNISQSIIGYEIYYGNTESTASNFLQDIMTV